MRVTPQRIREGGYCLAGARIRLRPAREAVTESFVGARPAVPAATPLPPRERGTPRPHLDVFVPVVADYRQLEPVILRALTERSARPFDIPRIGPVTATFSKVTVYGAPGGRLAVGVTVEAQPPATPQAATARKGAEEGKRVPVRVERG